MLGILSLVTGFLSPFIGDVFKFFTARQQNAHELAMLQESNKSAREIADLNAQVGLATQDVADVVSARQTQPQYGVRLLDAVQGDQGWVVRNFIKPFLLIMLTFIEVANGWMRPYAIYIILTLWASSKLGRFFFAYHAVLGGGDTRMEVLKALAAAATDTWGDHDWVALDYALGFLLGSRHKLSEAGKK